MSMRHLKGSRRLVGQISLFEGGGLIYCAIRVTVFVDIQVSLPY